MAVTITVNGGGDNRPWYEQAIEEETQRRLAQQPIMWGPGVQRQPMQPWTPQPIDWRNPWQMPAQPPAQQPYMPMIWKGEQPTAPAAQPTWGQPVDWAKPWGIPEQYREPTGPPTVDEYNKLIDRRIATLQPEVRTELASTAAKFKKLGYLDDTEAFMRLEVGDWVGQDVGMSREEAHRMSEQATPGIRERLPSQAKAMAAAAWLPLITKQWPGAAEAAPIAGRVPGAEAPAPEYAPTGIAGYMQKALERATAEYEPLRVPTWPPGPPTQAELSPEQMQAAQAWREAEQAQQAFMVGVGPELTPEQTAAFQAGPPTTPTVQAIARDVATIGPTWAGIKAIPVAGIFPRTVEEAFTAGVTGLTQGQYWIERGLGYAWLTGLEQPVTAEALMAMPMYGKAAQVLGKKRVEASIKQRLDISAKLIKLDITPREKLDLARTSLTWMVLPEKMGKVFDEMAGGATIDQLVRKHEDPAVEAIGQILLNVLDPINYIGIALGNVRDTRMMNKVRTQYVDRAAKALDVAVEETPLFKRALRAIGGKVEDLNPFNITARSKAKGLNRDINSFTGMVLASAESKSDAKALLRAFVDAPDQLPAEFGTFVRSPAADEVRKAFGLMDIDKFKSLKAPTAQDAMQLAMAGLEPPTAEFKVMDFLSELYDKSTQATSKLYGVKPPTTAEQWASGFKAYMGDFYFSNVGALAQNFAGNVAFAAYDGVMSFERMKDCENYLTRAYGFIPMQARRGLTVQEYYAPAEKGIPGLKQLASAFRKVYTGDSILGEAGSRIRQTVAYMRRFDNRYWQPGPGGLMDLSGFEDIWHLVDPSNKAELIAAWRQAQSAEELLANTNKVLDGGLMASRYLDDAEEVSPGFVSAVQDILDDARIADGGLDDAKLRQGAADLTAEVEKRVARAKQAETPITAEEVEAAFVRGAVRPKEAVVLPEVEHAVELAEGRPPEIAQRMYSNMVREQIEYGKTAEGLVLSADEMAKAAYELDMWEKGAWAENAWAKYVSADVPFPKNKITEMRRFVEQNPELAVKWQDYLVREMARRNTASWQLLQNDPYFRQIVGRLPLEDVKKIAAAQPPVREELAEILEEVGKTLPPGIEAAPTNIGDLALRYSIDPATATREDWAQVLRYAREDFKYHETRMLKEGVASVVDKKAERIPQLGELFGETAIIRKGRMSVKQMEAYRQSLKPAEMSWKKFYDFNGDQAQAFDDLIVELQSILELPDEEIATTLAKWGETWKAPEGYPRPEVWEIPVGRITPERLPTAPERVTPLLPAPAPGVPRPAIDHGIISPSGRVSERGREAALERTRQELFGAGLERPIVAQPTEVETLRRQAAELRDLAERGMKPRAYRKQAIELEKAADALEAAPAAPRVPGEAVEAAWGEQWRAAKSAHESKSLELAAAQKESKRIDRAIASKATPSETLPVLFKQGQDANKQLDMIEGELATLSAEVQRIEAARPVSKTLAAARQELDAALKSGDEARTMAARTKLRKVADAERKALEAAPPAGVVPGELPAMPTTYWKGDKVQYTGKTEVDAGATWYEVRILEGADTGQLRTIHKPPPVTGPIEVPATEFPTPRGELPAMPPLEAAAPGVRPMEAPPAAARGEVALGRGAEAFRKAEMEELAAGAPKLFEIPAEEVVTPAMRRTRLADLQEEITKLTLEMKRKPVSARPFYQKQIAQRQEEIAKLMGAMEGGTFPKASDAVASAVDAEKNMLRRLIDDETGAVRLGRQQVEQQMRPIPDDVRQTFVDRVRKTLVPARNDANMAKLQWAYEMVNRNLHDYDKMCNADRVAGLFWPYHFWPTRTAKQSAIRMVTKPWTVTSYYRISKAIEKYNREAGFPRRYGKTALFLPVPEAAQEALPEWAEPTLPIDIMPFIYPHTSVFPFTYLSKINWDDNEEAKGALDMVARLDEIFSMSPHMPINLAIEKARGKEEEIPYFVPQTAAIKGITAYLKEKNPEQYDWVPPGGLNIEAPIRKGLGMPEVPGYEAEYWPESMVVDMAANGEIGPDEAKALTTPGLDTYHMGPIWDEAVNRAAILKNLPSTIRFLTGFRPGLLPSGEMKLREFAREEITPLYEREEAGERGPAIRDERRKLYEENPWYIGRGLLWTPGPQRVADYREEQFYDKRNPIYDARAKELDAVPLGDWRAKQAVNQKYQGKLDALDTEYSDLVRTSSFWGMSGAEMVTNTEDQAFRLVADDYYAIQPENYTDKIGVVDWDAFYKAQEDFRDNVARLAIKKGILDTDVFADFSVGGKPNKAAITSWLTRSRFDQYLRRNDDPKEALWKVYKDTVITPAQNKMYVEVEGLDSIEKNAIFEKYYTNYSGQPATDFIHRIIAAYPERGWTYDQLAAEYAGILLPGLEETQRRGQSPRDRAISDLWDFYMALPALDKKRLKEGLGDRFGQLFVNKETRNYNAIADDELIQWMSYMGLDPGLLPEMAEARGAAVKAAEAQLMDEWGMYEPQAIGGGVPPEQTAETLKRFAPSAPELAAEYDQALNERTEMWAAVDAMVPNYSELMDAYSGLKWYEFDERAALKEVLDPVWRFMDTWKMEHPTMVKWFYPTWQPYTPTEAAPKKAAAPKAAAPKAAGGGAARQPTKQEALKQDATEWVEFAQAFQDQGLLELIQSYFLLSAAQRGWFLARNPELAAWLREQDADWLGKLKASLDAHLSLTGGAKRGYAWRRAPTLRWYKSW